MRELVSRILRPSGRPLAVAVVVSLIWAWAGSAVQAQSSAVTIKDFAFQPGTMQISVGATVTWTNQDTIAHTATSDTGVFDSGTLQQGSSFSFTFNQAGTYSYHCRIHPNMVGQIVVGSASAATATPVVSTPVAPTPVPSSGPQVQIANNAKLGPILVNSAGMTLYILTSEAGGALKCTGACLTNWPPLTLAAGSTAPTLGPGVTGDFASIQRPDGTVQATFRGFPLYTFAHDTAPGATNGDGIAAFGGTWQAARLQSAPLSATPAIRLSLHVSRVRGSLGGRVTARYALGGASRNRECSRATCALALPRGTSVNLTEAPLGTRFVGWKIGGPHGALIRSRGTHLTVESSMRVTALFRTR